jgi:hypothetical protein
MSQLSLIDAAPDSTTNKQADTMRTQDSKIWEHLGFQSLRDEIEEERQQHFGAPVTQHTPSCGTGYCNTKYAGNCG